MRVFLPEPTLNAASRGGHLTLRLVVLTWHTAHGTWHTAHVLSTDNNRPVVDLGFAKVGSVICKRQTAPQRVWVSGVLCAYTERWPSTVSIHQNHHVFVCTATTPDQQAGTPNTLSRRAALLWVVRKSSLCRLQLEETIRPTGRCSRLLRGRLKLGCMRHLLRTAIDVLWWEQTKRCV